jgi:hypothetical protein
MIANLEREKVALAIKPLKKPRAVQGAVASTELTPISAKDAEFLVYSNSYVRRGVEKTANAIVRNGYTITPESGSDKKMIEQFASTNSLTQMIINLTRNTCIYGNSYLEIALHKDYGPFLTLCRHQKLII